MSEEQLAFDATEDSPDLYEHHRFVIDKGQELLRIDKYLVMKLSGISRTRIQSAADAGNILVNNKAVKQNYKVKPLDTISVVLPFPPVEIELIPQDIPINIIYEDNDILMVNKDPGLVVHPGKGNYSGTLVNALLHHLKDVPGFENGTVRPGLVHRIDKDTSGILVVAKNEFALNYLARQFFEHSSERTYQAIVWGTFKEKTGTITGHIGRSLRDRLRHDVFPDGSQGRHSVTHYKVLRELGYVTLIECRLETGRTHQIRTHMSWIGHPLFNDELYGGARILKGPQHGTYERFVNNCFEVLPRQALHAKSLGFVHPGTRKKVMFDSELPADMQNFLDKWEKWLKANT